MAGLKHTLNVGSESLFASRQGVDTTGHNIANAHTDGYSRQRVNLETRVPSQSRGVVIGNGVFVKRGSNICSHSGSSSSLSDKLDIVNTCSPTGVS